ncbi:MAG: 4-(cytidine 5'-diphospho)-2-C-methyl-D-erythritol kinase [Lachnospiraceae bacterium]|jgi:4-diphosphocytidyl-2-C-methyl-D-erythritol kinase|nr:4-(cytidine 5'-diphospho)-2-C-methyl-D-erythritol kinase [Lachnospiraceae bacterium]MEE3460314.1 4-(cytidine 5'-diphospho)-2-C-methyl-D-erythritol kinase [Lachnospiraceae bacterium]
MDDGSAGKPGRTGEIMVKAPAKINLTLDITGTREDGYHLLKMVMQTVSLYDELEIRKNSSGKVTLSSNRHFVKKLPAKDNLVYKAAVKMQELCPEGTGFDIKLRKNIPSEAGLAGGSADCAAALKGINQLMGLGLSEAELADIGVKFGADVPFCVYGGTKLCEGIGEKITPLNDLAGIPVLIVKPKKGMSTEEVYSDYDREDDIEHPDNEAMLDIIAEIDANSAAAEEDDYTNAEITDHVYDICRYIGNVLETVVIPELPIIGEIKENLENYGALGSLMSGSGSAVYGLFDSVEAMLFAEHEMKRIYKDCKIYSCMTVNEN